MVNCSPSLPPVIGVRRMKIRPGMVTRPEMRKNQRRLPMMSNTRAGLSPDPRPTRPSCDELLLAHPEQAGLPGPAPGDDPAQDRPRHDDRAEHRDEDAEDQDEGEAADRRGPEEIEDRRGDEARHVRVEDRVP